MNILAVEAHPDDVEFLCAGTLARLAGLGHTISILSITGGECGSENLPPDEVRRVRLTEARKSAAVIGAEFYHAGVVDKQVFFTKEIRDGVCEIFRKVSADLIFALNLQDYVLDHVFASLLTRDCATAASVRNFATGVSNPLPATDKVPYLYYCAPFHGEDIFGNAVLSSTYVDIGEVLETKARMLSCHVSQGEFMKSRFGITDFVELMRTLGSRVGRQAGLTYAEGFRQHLAPPFPRENILVEMLGARDIGNKMSS